MEEKLLTQRVLAERSDLGEGTLERWRSEGTGPVYVKLGGQVRYRLIDIKAFEDESVRSSTSTKMA